MSDKVVLEVKQCYCSMSSKTAQIVERLLGMYLLTAKQDVTDSIPVFPHWLDGAVERAFGC